MFIFEGFFSFIHNISIHFAHDIRSGFYSITGKLTLFWVFSDNRLFYKRLEGFMHKLGSLWREKSWCLNWDTNKGQLTLMIDKRGQHQITLRHFSDIRRNKHRPTATVFCHWSEPVGAL